MSDLSDIKQREKRASDEIARLTEGNPGTNWRWSIPANPERDSDLILADSIADIPKLVAALEAVKRVCDANDGTVVTQADGEHVPVWLIEQVITEALS